MSDAPTRLSQPRPALAFLESAGPRELFYPPAQQILPGTKSWLNQPYALIAGFRLLRLDVHVPEDRKGPVPVIVFAPGGAWLIAPKNHMPWRQILAEGYAVVSIEYRLSGEAQFPAPLHDVKAAIRWVRQNAAAYGLDADRVVGWGCSAGGYLMSMAGVTNGMEDIEGDVGEALDQSSRLAAVIAHYVAGRRPAGVARDEGDALFLRTLARDADFAREAGIILTLEPLNPIDRSDYHILSIPHALDLIAASGRSNVRLQLDLYHCAKRGESVLEAIATYAQQTAHVQIAASPGRNEPERGGNPDPVVALYALAEQGYQGWVGCEYFPAGDTLAGLNWAEGLTDALTRKGGGEQ